MTISKSIKKKDKINVFDLSSVNKKTKGWYAELKKRELSLKPLKS